VVQSQLAGEPSKIKGERRRDYQGVVIKAS
jgi:hypothetical protein